MPPTLPAHKTRADRFDAAAVDAFSEIESRWRDHLVDLDVAVDDILGCRRAATIPCNGRTR